jgi:hypothetical protein
MMGKVVNRDFNVRMERKRLEKMETVYWANFAV